MSDLKYPRVYNPSWHYCEIETEHFFFRVWKAGGRIPYSARFLAETMLKIGKRKYQIEHGVFCSGNYGSVDGAYNAAVEWLLMQMEELRAEITEMEWIAVEKLLIE